MMTTLGHRWARLIALLLLVAAAGCAGGNTGTVTGGIIPCTALGYPGEPHYAAGIVTVLEGQLHMRSTGPGSSVAVLPTTVVATERVGVNDSHRFPLPPGDYILRAHFPPPANIEQWTAVTVRAGQTEHVDIPNTCI
jgi:hypothetical protein